MDFLEFLGFRGFLECRRFVMLFSLLLVFGFRVHQEFKKHGMQTGLFEFVILLMTTYVLSE